MLTAPATCRTTFLTQVHQNQVWAQSAADAQGDLAKHGGTLPGVRAMELLGMVMGLAFRDAQSRFGPGQVARFVSFRDVL